MPFTWSDGHLVDNRGADGRRHEADELRKINAWLRSDEAKAEFARTPTAEELQAEASRQARWDEVSRRLCFFEC